MGKDDPAIKSSNAFRGGFELKVIEDYRFDEVTSAMQKMIRRNQEYQACYWAYILHASGYYKYVWKRLMVIASEDVGNGNPMAAVVVNSLRQNYEATIDSKSRNRGDALLFIFQATMYLCRSEKLRDADTITNLLLKEFENGKRLEIPEVALDPHTDWGKQVHGKWDEGTPEEITERARKWHDEWSYVTPASKTKDRYLARMKELDGIKEQVDAE